MTERKITDYIPSEMVDGVIRYMMDIEASARKVCPECFFETSMHPDINKEAHAPGCSLWPEE